MRIAFMSGMDGYPWGGSEALWSSTAGEMISRGHSVQVAVAKWPTTPKPIEDLRMRGAEVIEWPRHQPTLAAMVRAKLAYLLKFDANTTWRAIKDFKPDLACISHGGTVCGLDWMVKCKNAGIPYVSVSQANTEQWWPTSRNYEEIRTVHRSAVLSCFVSEANLRLFECQIGSRLPNGTVVRNPFNVDWNVAIPWTGTAEPMRIACVGRLEPPAKGQDILFLMLALDKWRERPVILTLYGTGPCEKPMKDLVTMLGLDAKVRFAGHVNEISKIWEDNHCLVLPSRHEGLPLSLVEAMLCARAAVVTDVAGHRELIDDGVTGFIAEAATVNHLDAAMERAWLNRHQLMEMGQAASTVVRQRVPKNPVSSFADLLLHCAPTS